MTEPRSEIVKQSLPDWLSTLPESEQRQYLKIFAIMRQINPNPDRD